MTDRRRRAALRRPLPPLLPLPADGGPTLLRERKGGGGDTEASDPGSNAGGGTGASEDDNPFAPPPAGRPDQPWQPRRPTGDDTPAGSSSDSSSSGGSGWGSKWSTRQPPGRGNGGFGGPGSGGNGGPGRGQNGQNGPEGSEGGPGTGLRWDPTDPAQRRARYALLAGMWAFFFALFTQREISLLLGALALYWGISSLRNKQKPNGTPHPAMAPATTPAPPVNTRPQTTAAVSGLVTAVLALVIVATTFTVQLVYRDYYTCVSDSLTKAAQVSCNEELPKSLIPVFGVKE